MGKAWIETAGDDALAFMHGISRAGLGHAGDLCPWAADAHKASGDISTS